MVPISIKFEPEYSRNSRKISQKLNFIFPDNAKNSKLWLTKSCSINLFHFFKGRIACSRTTQRNEKCSRSPSSARTVRAASGSASSANQRTTPARVPTRLSNVPISVTWPLRVCWLAVIYPCTWSPNAPNEWVCASFVIATCCSFTWPGITCASVPACRRIVRRVASPTSPGIKWTPTWMCWPARVRAPLCPARSAISAVCTRISVPACRNTTPTPIFSTLWWCRPGWSRWTPRDASTWRAWWPRLALKQRQQQGLLLLLPRRMPPRMSCPVLRKRKSERLFFF